MHNLIPNLLMWAALALTGAPGEPVSMAADCDLTDCVWPGDANGSAVADVYDLLNIGLGHSTSGPERPNAHLGWEGQPAPDWGQYTGAGVNYKHLDCDGDGIIHDDDVEAISLNYGIAPPPTPYPQPGGIPIYFAFDVDTIFVNEDSPPLIPVKGRIYVGDAQNPADNLHGLAVSLLYNQPAILLSDSTSAAPLSTSFCGPSYENLWTHKNLSGEQRLDLALSRKGGLGVSGFGAVAEAGFVIISDIIGGFTEIYIPLEIVIGGLHVVDGNGAPVPYHFPAPPQPLIIVNDFVLSAAKGPEAEADIKLYPNPAQNRIWVEWGDLDVQSARLCNSMGQALRPLPLNGTGLQEWSLEGLPEGLYALQLQTSKGLLVRKFLVAP
jgi:hypothetical protein